MYYTHAALAIATKSYIPASQSVSQSAAHISQSYSVRSLSIVLFAVCYLLCVCVYVFVCGVLSYSVLFCAAVSWTNSCRYFIYSPPPPPNIYIYLKFNTVSLSLIHQPMCSVVFLLMNIWIWSFVCILNSLFFMHKVKQYIYATHSVKFIFGWLVWDKHTRLVMPQTNKKHTEFEKKTEQARKKWDVRSSDGHWANGNKFVCVRMNARTARVLTVYIFIHGILNRANNVLCSDTWFYFGNGW